MHHIKECSIIICELTFDKAGSFHKTAAEQNISVVAHFTTLLIKLQLHAAAL